MAVLTLHICEVCHVQVKLCDDVCSEGGSRLTVMMLMSVLIAELHYAVLYSSLEFLGEMSYHNFISHPATCLVLHCSWNAFEDAL